MDRALKRIVGLVALTLLLATGLATVAVGLAVPALGVPWPQPGPTPVEGEQFSGDWSPVVDAQATNGTAVVINSGAITTQTTTNPGSYTLNVRVRSGGARVALTMNGEQVDTKALYGGAWQTVSVPVRVSGTPTWGIQPLPGVGYTPQPVYVDWLSLENAPGGLTTVGNRIVDAQGQQLTPRGVVRGGFQFKPAGDYHLNDFDVSEMYQWGANTVRLPLDQLQWLSSSCTYDPTYMQRLDAEVNSITQRGMVAVLTLSRAGKGKLCTQSALVAMADDYSVQFWTEVANHYKSNPLVAFDLFNEPHDVTEAVWHDGGMMAGAWHAVGMQQLYDTVRSTGATNLTFISGTSWAFHIDVSLRRPVDGYGIVYGTHLYNPPEDGPVRPDADSVIPPTAARYPVAVTEFGSSSGSGLYNQNVINYAESNGIGWLAYQWFDTSATFGLLQSFYTYDPSPAGQPVRDALWKAKGWTTPGGQ